MTTDDTRTCCRWVLSERNEPSLMTADRLVDAPVGMGHEWMERSFTGDQVTETLFSTPGLPVSDSEAEHGPSGFSPESQKHHHPQPSLPTSGYVERWHAHIATTDGPHRCHPEYSPEDVSGWTSAGTERPHGTPCTGTVRSDPTLKAPAASNTRETVGDPQATEHTHTFSLYNSIYHTHTHTHMSARNVVLIRCLGL